MIFVPWVKLFGLHSLPRMWCAIGRAGVVEVSLWGCCAMPLIFCHSQGMTGKWGVAVECEVLPTAPPCEDAPSAHRKFSTRCGFEARVCSKHEADHSPLDAESVRGRWQTHLKLALTKTETLEKCNLFNGIEFSPIALHCSEHFYHYILYYLVLKKYNPF